MTVSGRQRLFSSGLGYFFFVLWAERAEAIQIVGSAAQPLAWPDIPNPLISDGIIMPANLASAVSLEDGQGRVGLWEFFPSLEAHVLLNLEH